jgi:hypothetical protein
MGARYALFALVGIADEDDRDAPDLNGAARTGFGRSPEKKIRTNTRSSVKRILALFQIEVVEGLYRRR